MIPPRTPAENPAEPGDPNPAPHSLGALGEVLAEASLRSHGFRIEARNLRTRDGEIDLLVRKSRLWIAVEVKTRRFHFAPEQCVSPAQRERLHRTLRRLAAVLQPPPRALRVDVVAVVVRPDRSPEITHFPGNEFEPPSR